MGWMGCEMWLSRVFYLKCLARRLAWEDPPNSKYRFPTYSAPRSRHVLHTNQVFVPREGRYRSVDHGSNSSSLMAASHML